MSQEQITLDSLEKYSREELQKLSRQDLESCVKILEAIPHRTTKQQLILLQSRIELVKKELHSPTTAAVLSSKSPKKSIIVLWAEYLESEYQLQVENKLPTEVESIGHISSHIKTQLRDMGVETQMSWVHESLPHKYKLHDTRPEDETNLQDDANRRQDSSLNIDPKLENKKIIELLEKEIRVKQSIKHKLGTSHFMSLLSDDEKKLVEELYLKAYNVIDITGDLFDDRVSCPVMLQWLLLNAHIEATDNFAAGIYVSKVKDFGANRWDEAKKLINKQFKIIADAKPEIKKLKRTLDKLDPKSEDYKIAKQTLKAEQLKERNAKLAIKMQKQKDTMTSKQTMKIIHRKMKNLLPILEPANRDDAISIGYNGMRCENCGSYRTYRDLIKGKMTTVCLACEAKFDAKFASKCPNLECNFPFYDDVIQVMIKNVKPKDGALDCKCPRCGQEVVLSQKYLKQAVEN